MKGEKNRMLQHELRRAGQRGAQHVTCDIFEVIQRVGSYFFGSSPLSHYHHKMNDLARSSYLYVSSLLEKEKKQDKKIGLIFIPPPRPLLKTAPKMG